MGSSSRKPGMQECEQLAQCASFRKHFICLSTQQPRCEQSSPLFAQSCSLGVSGVHCHGLRCSGAPRRCTPASNLHSARLFCNKYNRDWNSTQCGSNLHALPNKCLKQVYLHHGPAVAPIENRLPSSRSETTM